MFVGRVCGQVILLAQGYSYTGTLPTTLPTNARVLKTLPTNARLLETLPTTLPTNTRMLYTRNPAYKYNDAVTNPTDKINTTMLLYWKRETLPTK